MVILVDTDCVNLEPSETFVALKLLERYAQALGDVVSTAVEGDRPISFCVAPSI